MKILVTGGHGFIGRHLTKALAQEHTVMAVGSKSAKTGGGSALDLTSPQECGSFIRRCDRPVDAIIHLAARVCTRENAQDWGLLEENMVMTKNMVQIALGLQPKLFIHGSSIGVYSGQSGDYTEDAPVDMSANGDGLYGLAKFNAEMLFNFFLRNKMTVMNVRMAQVYGPGMRPDRIIPSLLAELRKNNTVTLYGNGERVVNFIHVDDVVKTMAAMIKRPCPGTFNVAHRRHVTLRELAGMLVKAYGNGQSRVVIMEAGSKAQQRINTDKVQKLFGVDCSTFDFSRIEV